MNSSQQSGNSSAGKNKEQIQHEPSSDKQSSQGDLQINSSQNASLGLRRNRTLSSNMASTFDKTLSLQNMSIPAAGPGLKPSGMKKVMSQAGLLGFGTSSKFKATNLRKQLSQNNLLAAVSNKHQTGGRRKTLLSFPVKNMIDELEMKSFSSQEKLIKIIEEKSVGCDSDDSIAEPILLEMLPSDLQDYIFQQKSKRIPKLIEMLTKYTHVAFAKDTELKVQVCSSQWMYNMIQNESDKILQFDMRSIYDILRGHLNHNFKGESNIPVPSDYVVENKLDISDLKDWIGTRIFEQAEFKQFNLVNEVKNKKFQTRRRSYVFVIATNTYDLSNFRLGEIFDKKYRNEIISSNNLALVKDYVSLRNAIILMSALKQERVFREVYLLNDSQFTFEHRYRFLMSSHFNRYQHRVMMPPESSSFHTGQTYFQLYPNEIISGQLFLGDANHATSEYAVSNLKITHIVNVTDCIPNAFQQEQQSQSADVDSSNSVSLNVEYLRIDVPDLANVQIYDYFPQFYWFLEQSFNQNDPKNKKRAQQPKIDLQCMNLDFTAHTSSFSDKSAQVKTFNKIHEILQTPGCSNRVLVHCQMGRSRSASLIIMYIIFKTIVQFKMEHLDSATIVKYVKSCREVVDPNSGFVKQIKQFEAMCRSGEVQNRINDQHRQNILGGFQMNSNTEMENQQSS